MSLNQKAIIKGIWKTHERWYATEQKKKHN